MTPNLIEVMFVAVYHLAFCTENLYYSDSPYHIQKYQFLSYGGLFQGCDIIQVFCRWSSHVLSVHGRCVLTKIFLKSNKV